MPLFTLHRQLNGTNISDCPSVAKKQSPHRRRAIGPRWPSAEQLLRGCPMARSPGCTECRRSKQLRCSLPCGLWPASDSVVPSSSSRRGPQSLASAGGAEQRARSDRIGGVADDVLAVRSSPSGPEMSQTSQTDAHRRGIDRKSHYPGSESRGSPRPGRSRAGPSAKPLSQGRRHDCLTPCQTRPRAASIPVCLNRG